MKRTLPSYVLALVAFALVLSLNVSAENPAASTVAPVCSSEMPFSELLAVTDQVTACNSVSMCSAEVSPFFVPEFVAQAVSGCSASSCNTSCRAQGYDYGVCFGSYCICRFYL